VSAASLLPEPFEGGFFNGGFLEHTRYLGFSPEKLELPCRPGRLTLAAQLV
jgi:hypothetical protein